MPTWPSRFFAAVSPVLSLGILAALFGVTELDAQTAYPVAGAPYSGGVTSPSGATLAVIGGVTGDGADMVAAAAAALEDLEARLAEVGLTKAALLRVRAALAPGDGSEFAAWTEAWTAFFDGGHLPARTTVGSAGLPGGAGILIDAVAAFPLEAGFPADVPDAVPGPNPNIRYAGPSGNPTAIVYTGSGLFLASGQLPGRGEGPEASTMEWQMRSSMSRVGGALYDHGLTWNDAFFVRIMPTPQPDRSEPDFAAWAPVYASLDEMTAGPAPAYSMWAAPGFGASGRFVEIEAWAAPQAPSPAFAAFDGASANPMLKMTGGERSMIASGAIIGPYAELLWISGVVAPAGTAPEEESAAALSLMAERLTEMGASMSDVAELRVYRVPVDGEDALGPSWNEAYGATWGSEANPHKPVRTNYLVESLPGGRHVEVEAVIVLPPKAF